MNRRKLPTQRPNVQSGQVYNPECWLAKHGVMERDEPMPSCEGHLVRVHLLPRQLLKRSGADPLDERSFVAGCGGIWGNSGHHGMLDVSMTLRIPREAIPEEVEELACEYGLEYWLDRVYGERPPRADWERMPDELYWPRP